MKNVLVDNFLRISKIPRTSSKEEKIANFFVEIAKQNNLYYYKDENNNVLIRKKGNRKSEPLALQAHLDMVCVKKEKSNHNFETEGINVVINSDEVTAIDTSLGADQGVGLAMMLAIMEDKELKHPDLEFLLTVEEETTFKGVVTFPYEKVESKRLINLDNSKDDSIFIGADGDICKEYCFKSKLIENNLPSYRIIMDGFIGGNSGENISLSENNAISTVAKILINKDVYLKSIKGGTSENDIATFCEVIINTTLNVEELFKEQKTKIEKIDNKKTFSKEDTKNILTKILELKSGYLNKNTSANLGKIITETNEVKIYYVIRSINEKELENINIKNKNLNNNFLVNEIYRDPIWNVNKNSKLLHKYKEVYFKEYHEYPKEEIGHGGIECASIKNSLNKIDIISIGSNMENCHTVKEKTYISSWLKTYNLLIKFIASL